MQYKKQSPRKRRGLLSHPQTSPSRPALLRAHPRAAQAPISSPSCTSCCSGCDGPAPRHPEQPRLNRAGSGKLWRALEERSARTAEPFLLPDGAEPAAPPLRPAGKSPAAAPGWGLGVSHPPPEELSKKACSLLPGLSREGEKHTPESHPL